jgi:hypothetical protein
MDSSGNIIVSIGNFRISWQLLIVTLSFIISIISMLSSRRAIKYTMEIRKKENTDKFIDIFNSQNFQNKLKWIENELQQYIDKNKIQTNNGLSLLNRYPSVKINIDGKITNVQAGNLCKDVLIFYNKVSKELKNNNVETEDILEDMMISMKSIWSILTKILVHEQLGGYYRFFRKKYSLGSLVHSIRNEEDFRKAAKKLRNKWT